MNLFRYVTEMPASLRWHVGSTKSKLIYSRALGQAGEGLTILSPLKLTGTHISFLEGNYEYLSENN